MYKKGYFADFEEKELVYSTCIHMSGETSAISIWEDNNLIHQCSIHLARHEIFSQFIKLNSRFAEEKFGLDPREWKGLGSGAFSAKLNVWLRYISKQWLVKNRASQRRDTEFQGLTRLMAIGIAGLYYYVGILLRVLKKETKYQRDEITPVYLGGDASRFVDWLDPAGTWIDEEGQLKRWAEINDLFSRMLSKGSGLDETKESVTTLSKKRQDEIACGLVLNQTKLKGLGRKAIDPIIAGESCLMTPNRLLKRWSFL